VTRSPVGRCSVAKKKQITKEPRAKVVQERTRYRFFLNPYPDMAFTKCPKCETKTRQRKLPLVSRRCRMSGCPGQRP